MRYIKINTVLFDEIIAPDNQLVLSKTDVYNEIHYYLNILGLNNMKIDISKEEYNRLSNYLLGISYLEMGGTNG